MPGSQSNRSIRNIKTRKFIRYGDHGDDQHHVGEDKTTEIVFFILHFFPTA